jgi:nicotinamide-nucleotide amidase
VKASLLGVEQHLLDAHGPVHPRVASQMAEGVRRALGRTACPPTSAWRRPASRVRCRRTGSPSARCTSPSPPLGSRVESVLIDGDRAAIRAETAARAVRLVLDAL